MYPPCGRCPENITGTKQSPSADGWISFKNEQQTRSRQIAVDRAHKCDSAAAHGDRHGRGPEPFGELCPQQWAKRVCDPETNCRASSIESSDNAFLLVRLKLPQQQQQQQQQSRRVLLLSPPQQEQQKQLLRRRWHLLTPSQQRRPVPSAASTAPPKAHEATKGRGSTSVRHCLTYLQSPPP